MEEQCELCRRISTRIMTMMLTDLKSDLNIIVVEDVQRPTNAAVQLLHRLLLHD